MHKKSAKRSPGAPARRFRRVPAFRDRELACRGEGCGRIQGMHRAGKAGRQAGLRVPGRIVRALAAGFGLALCLPGCALFSADSGLVGRELDDAAITARVRAGLLQTGELEQFRINVTTDEGEVYLVGRAPGEESRRQAEEAARSVPGVWSVINHLRIGARSRSTAREDAELRRNVESALSDDPDVPGLAIQILVYEREVYLIGRVPAGLQRSRALRLVRETRGVRRIHNYLKAGRVRQQES